MITFWVLFLHIYTKYYTHFVPLSLLLLLIKPIHTFGISQQLHLVCVFGKEKENLARAKEKKELSPILVYI